MKKQLILILFLLGNLTTSFSQQYKKTAFNDLVGSYSGFPLGENSSAQISVEITKDFNLKITENFDGLLIELINEKVFPNAAEKFEDGAYAFYFRPVSKESEFSNIKLIIFSEPIVPNSEYSISATFKKEEDELRAFVAKKIGGNPSIPNQNILFKDIYTSVFYKGKTQDNTFGDYKIEWFPTQGVGTLEYEHLRNMFLINKDGGEYQVKDRSYQDDIVLDYFFGKNGKTRFKSVVQGKSFFAKKRIKEFKKSKESIDEKDFLKFVATSLHDMVKPRFRPTDNYTLSESEKNNGSGIKFFVENKKTIAYAGNFKDGTFHGQGSVILADVKKSGVFNNGSQHGQFYIIETQGEASGRYVDNEQEGTWKVKLNNGATFEKVFRNGKEISSKATNKGVKNTQITKHVDDAEYQLKGTKRLFTEIGNISNRCGERTTLRSYQSCYRTLKPKIDAFSVGIVAGIRELEKAKKEAEKSKCALTLQVLENAEDDLWEANGALGDAFKAATEVYHATTVAKAKAENRKCINAINKSVDAMNEFNVWIASLGLNECYTYSTTNKGNLPSKNTSQTQSTARNKTYSKSNTSSSSSSSSQNTTAPKTKTITSSPVDYPTFTGKYEGDNLLRLMGRKIDDSAVQKLLKDPSYKFERKDRSGSLREKIDYECFPYRFSLSFINGVMTYISFEVKEWDKDHFFKKKLPLNIPLAKSTSAMKRMKDKWKHNDYGSSSNWTLKKYQLNFEVWGGGENNDIHIVSINAEDITDWNSYYRQFK